MSYFSLALTEEQQDLRHWVHGFAARVVRPRRPSGTPGRRPRGR